MGSIQPALKLMERLLCVPFSSCWSLLAAPMISLAFILADLQVLPKHHASCSYTRTDRKRERQDKNPFSLCGGQGAWNGSCGSSVGNKLGSLSQAALSRLSSLPQMLRLYCHGHCQQSQELLQLSTFVKHYMMSSLRSLDTIPYLILV